MPGQLRPNSPARTCHQDPLTRHQIKGANRIEHTRGTTQKVGGLNRGKRGCFADHRSCPCHPNPGLTRRRHDLLEQGPAGPWIDDDDLRQLNIPPRQAAQNKGQSAQRAQNGAAINGAASASVIGCDEPSDTHWPRGAAVLSKKISSILFCTHQHHGRCRAIFKRQGGANISTRQTAGKNPSKTHKQDGQTDHQNRRRTREINQPIDQEQQGKNQDAGRGRSLGDAPNVIQGGESPNAAMELEERKDKGGNQGKGERRLPDHAIGRSLGLKAITAQKNHSHRCRRHQQVMDIDQQGDLTDRPKGDLLKGISRRLTHVEGSAAANFQRIRVRPWRVSGL